VPDVETVSNGYCSVDDVRDHLRDTGAKLENDLIVRAINGASRAIDHYCGRRFWQDASVATRTYQPDNPYVAWVDDMSTTTGLVIKTDTTGDYTWATTWTTDDYDLEPRNADADGGAYAWWRIIAIGEKTFPVYQHRQSLQVTDKFGWSAVPDDIHLAAILKSSALYKRKDALFGVAGFGEFGAVRITRRDPDVMELLTNYVRTQLVSV
jgi:hypothetical protein